MQEQQQLPSGCPKVTWASCRWGCCRYNRAVVVAVGDPLAPEAQWRGLTSLFVKEFPEAYFYHSSQAYASVLQDMGYWVNDVGAETTLQVRECVRACVRAMFVCFGHRGGAG